MISILLVLTLSNVIVDSASLNYLNDPPLNYLNDPPLNYLDDPPPASGLGLRQMQEALREFTRQLTQIPSDLQKIFNRETSSPSPSPSPTTDDNTVIGLRGLERWINWWDKTVRDVTSQMTKLIGGLYYEGNEDKAEPKIQGRQQILLRPLAMLADLVLMFQQQLLDLNTQLARTLFNSCSGSGCQRLGEVNAPPNDQVPLEMQKAMLQLKQLELMMKLSAQQMNEFVTRINAQRANSTTPSLI